MTTWKVEQSLTVVRIPRIKLPDLLQHQMRSEELLCFLLINHIAAQIEPVGIIKISVFHIIKV